MLADIPPQAKGAVDVTVKEDKLLEETDVTVTQPIVAACLPAAVPAEQEQVTTEELDMELTSTNIGDTMEEI